MIERFIHRVFLKNKEPELENIRSLYIMVCSVLGIILNIFLFAGKFFVGVVSGSVAIQSDAFNNLSDAASSVITYLGLKLSAKKPDPEHPFGHGRIEYLSGLAVSILILIMGVELAKESIDKIINPQNLNDSYFIVTMTTLAIAIAVKLLMWHYNRKYGKRVNSSGMVATATDSLSDAAATLAVMISSIIVKFTGFHRIDGVCGTLVSLFILVAGFRAIKETLIPLLGQPPKQEFIESIEKIVLSHEPILGIHDLVVHDYGPGRVMISLHAEVPFDISVLEVHDVIDNAEIELKESLRCEAVIHCDPVDYKNPKTLRLREDLNAILEAISPQISMHDFRVVHGKSHTNLVFDLLIPHGFQLPPSELCTKIRHEILKLHPHHFCVIQIDYDYSNIHCVN